MKQAQSALGQVESDDDDDDVPLVSLFSSV